MLLCSSPLSLDFSGGKGCSRRRKKASSERKTAKTVQDSYVEDSLYMIYDIYVYIQLNFYMFFPSPD